MKETSAQVYIALPSYGDTRDFLERIFSEKLNLYVESSSGSGFRTRFYPSHGVKFQSSDENSFLVYFNRAKGDFVVSGNVLPDTFLSVVDDLRQELIYVFDPERLKIGSCAALETTRLDPSARNLPAVLATMARNPAKWSVFNRHVSEVFPSVKAVMVSTLNSEIAVYIWQNDPEKSNDDYAILLQDSGTGLGQVISILYVAMTYSGSVIAIDEPNSFLHPGAAKKLMSILKQYDRNQYIISTHSPELIDVIDPDRMLSVSWKDGESHVEVLDRNSIEHLQSILTDLGCDLADVFSVNRVIWCEGPTEVSAFPMIARASGINISMVAFLKLRATGDLEKRVDANIVMDIYATLASGLSILPKSTTFNLDREGRSSKEIDDIIRQSKGRAKFLPARTLENFLVDPDAIAAVLRSEFERTGTEGEAPTRDQIEQWLEMRAAEFAPQGVDWRHEDVNAPKLLDAMMSDLTNHAHIYRKTLHSLELAKWLMANKPGQLQALVSYVRDLVEVVDG